MFPVVIFDLIIFVDDDFCFSILFGCCTIHISCNFHCFLTCLHTLPALSSHIFIKSNQSNSTNHQGPPGENDLEAAGNLSQRTLESPMRCSPDLSIEPDSGSGPTLTTDLPPPSTGQDATLRQGTCHLTMKRLNTWTCQQIQHWNWKISEVKINRHKHIFLVYNGKYFYKSALSLPLLPLDFS